MRRPIALALSVLLCLTPVLSGQAMISGFTHPELGELLTVQFDNNMPSFSIYDFPYYVVANSAAPLRGMKANFTTLPHKDMLSMDTALEMLFESLTHPDYSLYSLVYTGLNEEHAQALSKLPVDQRIQAIKLLNGFGGAQGYAGLKDFAGFEAADVGSLSASHLDYQVKIGKDLYPYRVLTFHFEGEDWVSFNERYGFLWVDGQWKLSRATTEYTDDYLARGKYIHGISGSDPDTMEEVTQEVMRGTRWGMTVNEVAALEGINAKGKTLTNPQVEAFRIPAKVQYAFGEEGLNKITYTFSTWEAYFSSFLSLYMRYSDPITIDRKANMTWCMNDMLITLKYNGASPAVTIEPYSGSAVTAFSIG